MAQYALVQAYSLKFKTVKPGAVVFTAAGRLVAAKSAPCGQVWVDEKFPQGGARGHTTDLRDRCPNPRD